MKLSGNPLFEALASSRSVLVAGAGGGFDVYSGLPLYFGLRAQGKAVHLANLSFAHLPDDPCSTVSPACVRVDADTVGYGDYFPERTLSRWFRDAEGEEVPVYGFRRCGVAPLREAYETLRRKLGLDALVLVDGGTDSLMRGDEFGLGTPDEDITSIVAADGAGFPTKILSCLGFGVDHFHGVCHAYFLEAVAALTREGAFLGTLPLLPQMEEARRYLAAVDHSTAHTIARPSIVSTSIASAVRGHFGDHHSTRRTEGSKLWINPLMAQYWSFELGAVRARNLYAETLEGTQSLASVSRLIEDYRRSIDRKDWIPIPL